MFSQCTLRSTGSCQLSLVSFVRVLLCRARVACFWVFACAQVPPQLTGAALHQRSQRGHHAHGAHLPRQRRVRYAGATSSPPTPAASTLTAASLHRAPRHRRGVGGGHTHASGVMWSLVAARAIPVRAAACGCTGNHIWFTEAPLVGAQWRVVVLGFLAASSILTVSTQVRAAPPHPHAPAPAPPVP
jgi:hypothetical protein